MSTTTDKAPNDEPSNIPDRSRPVTSSEPDQIENKIEKNPVVRLSVNMNSETADALREIARLHGVSVTEAVRRAISIASWVEQESAEGNSIQVTDKRSGRVRELVLM